jgi:MFS family permease
MSAIVHASGRSAPKPLQVAAAVIGNALEWYDFISFGFLSVVISRLFFPAESQYASLLLTFATFGVGFFMRPVGGIVLGIYTDKHGRKAGMLAVVALMTVAIAMLAFAPTYAAIGLGAPLIIVVARLLQGFSAGGEFGSSTSFLIESAPPDKRGFYGSWQFVGQGLAALLGALVGAAVTRGLSPEAVDAWGWRIPFLIGLLIGPVGLYIRRYVEEPEEFVQVRRTRTVKPRLVPALAAHLRELWVCLGIGAAGTSSFYVILLYMPTFASTQLHLPLDQAFLAQSLALACMISIIPFSGALSDRVGRKPIFVSALTCYIAVAYPLFAWVQAAPSFGRLAAVQIVFCSLIGIIYGPMATALSEQFPVGVRSTCLSVGYNLPVLIFGGFAQFFVTLLIQVTGSPIAPAFYLMFGSALGLLACLSMREHMQRPNLVQPVAQTIPAE